jgi:preprotein translocase subunit YajC
MESQGNLLTSLLPLIVLFGIFYFLIIRPQQKQAKEHKAMVESLKKGDKLISAGGLVCEVIKPEEYFIKVKLNDDMIVKLSREHISRKLDEL